MSEPTLQPKLQPRQAVKPVEQPIGPKPVEFHRPVKKVIQVKDEEAIAGMSSSERTALRNIDRGLWHLKIGPSAVNGRERQLCHCQGMLVHMLSKT